MYSKPMNLDDVLARHLGIQEGAMTPDVYGIEVELEGKNFLVPPASVRWYWALHKDQSLRMLMPDDHCIEYVFRQPYDMKNTEKAITVLFEYITSDGVEVYDSYRTSIHVHVNMAMEKFRTIYNFITLCLILDELLVSQNGEHRIGNNFCLRAKDALGQVISLNASVQNNNNFFAITDKERYSSINFASLTKFGSVEFRSLECTTHQGRLIHWINTLNAIKQKAKTFKNPIEVISQFSMMGPDQFLKSVLGPFALKYLSVPGYDEMLRTGMRIAQDFAYCSAWNESEAITEGKFDKLPKLEAEEF